MNYKKVICNLTEKEHKKLKIFAAKHQKSLNFIVKQALRELFVKHLQKEIE